MNYLELENRTLYTMDNILVLQRLPSESIDLIATDPPFNKDRDFKPNTDSSASKFEDYEDEDYKVEFFDKWTWNETEPHWHDYIKDFNPAVWSIIQFAKQVYGDNMGAFLCFMGIRLVEMNRILKDTGSIYLHCDPSSSHYLKALMDAIFGKEQFRNEINWCYSSGGVSNRYFARKHDIILFYSKTNKYTFNTPRVPHTSKINESNKHLFNPNGKVMMDYWTDIQYLHHKSKERTGWPTQKPLALYERIIKASSNPGDFVLDPFAGCATTCLAAEHLNRKWIAIDRIKSSKRIIDERIDRDENLSNNLIKIIKVKSKLPKFNEESLIGSVHINRRHTNKKHIESKPILEDYKDFSRERMIEELSNAQLTKSNLIGCAGCGRELEKRFMELDHMWPKAEGGGHLINNRILLCRPCNSTKSNTLTLTQLIKHNEKDGWMKDYNKAINAKQKVNRKIKENNWG